MYRTLFFYIQHIHEFNNKMWDVLQRQISILYVQNNSERNSQLINFRENNDGFISVSTQGDYMHAYFFSRNKNEIWKILFSK